MAVLVGFSTVLPAVANDSKKSGQSIAPSKLALIKEVLDLANLDNTIDRMWTACLKKISADLYKLSLRDFSANTTLSTAEQEEKAREQARKLTENLSAHFKEEYYRSYKEIYIDIYDQFFSQEDLEAMKAFFGTEAGRKSKAITPRMIKELVVELKERVNPRIKSSLRKRLEDMDAARAKEAEESKI
ncbi:DUF2059 domain-containing protein [bacterium]|nr:DUF2059 domain-containing protein [bacterium]